MKQALVIVQEPAASLLLAEIYKVTTALGLPMRVPHYTCGRAAAVAETELAAGGVLVLPALDFWRRSTLEAISAADSRATLLLGLASPTCPQDIARVVRNAEIMKLGAPLSIRELMINLEETTNAVE